MKSRDEDHEIGRNSCDVALVLLLNAQVLLFSRRRFFIDLLLLLLERLYLADAS